MRGENMRLVFLLITLVFSGGSAAAYNAIAIDDGATIRGHVTYEGLIPEADIYYMQKNPRVCGQAIDAHAGTRSVSMVRVHERMLRDVVLLLDGVNEGKPFPKDFSDFAAFRSRWCTWDPRIGVFVNGDPITIINLDPVVHNPIGYETVGRARLNHFNVPLHMEGLQFHQPVELRKGRVLKLECLQHQFMHSWIFAVDNPYFAIAGDRGDFRIQDIPPGSYSLTAWHPTLGRQSASVTLTANQTLEVTFEFR
ncbi:MAG TPA: carboxypeptidase regulatory-like domain-containing protein [Nitrospirales bacterium]|nr:carboxypeptidase regulatory-like domain-containing protein [Nitrospirales bacterium]